MLESHVLDLLSTKKKSSATRLLTIIIIVLYIGPKPSRSQSIIQHNMLCNILYYSAVSNITP